jgi:hypothetical protein
MGDLTIRAIGPDELPTFMQALEQSFHSRFSEEDLERERLIPSLTVSSRHSMEMSSSARRERARPR